MKFVLLSFISYAVAQNNLTNSPSYIPTFFPTNSSNVPSISPFLIPSSSPTEIIQRLPLYAIILILVFSGIFIGVSCILIIYCILCKTGHDETSNKNVPLAAQQQIDSNYKYNSNENIKQNESTNSRRKDGTLQDNSVTFKDYTNNDDGDYL